MNTPELKSGGHPTAEEIAKKARPILRMLLRGGSLPVNQEVWIAINPTLGMFKTGETLLEAADKAHTTWPDQIVYIVRRGDLVSSLPKDPLL